MAQQEQTKQINQEHVINSLANRIANMSIEIAQKDATIIEQQQELDALQQELGQLKTEAKTPKK